MHVHWQKSKSNNGRLYFPPEAVDLCKLQENEGE